MSSARTPNVRADRVIEQDPNRGPVRRPRHRGGPRRLQRQAAGRRALRGGQTPDGAPRRRSRRRQPRGDHAGARVRRAGRPGALDRPARGRRRSPRAPWSRCSTPTDPSRCPASSASSRPEAEQVIRDAGFEPVVRGRRHSTQPRGTVIRPEPGRAARTPPQGPRSPSWSRPSRSPPSRPRRPSHRRRRHRRRPPPTRRSPPTESPAVQRLAAPGRGQRSGSA